MIGAAVYVLLLTFFAPLPYYNHFLPPTSSTVLQDLKQGTSTIDAGVAFPHHSLSTYLASLLSLLIATFLGFLDDLFDIRWRYKLPIPSKSRFGYEVDKYWLMLFVFLSTVIASVPLLVVYFAGHGVTDVVVPRILGLRTLLNVEHVNGVLKLGTPAFSSVL
jgi:UDP-N-acetylglucosamine--dolichyl-phosphate N-acetylglucosaminephosphotransferase